MNAREPESISEVVRLELMRQVYPQIIPVSLMLVLGTALVTLALWNITPHAALLETCAAVVAVSAVRWILALRFRQRGAEPGQIETSERAFLLSLFLTASVVGVAGLAIMPAQSVPYQALVFLFLVCAMASGMASYAVHPHAVVAMLPMLLPSFGWFMRLGDLTHRALALAGVLMAAGFFRASRKLAFSVRRSYQLSHELQIAREKAEQLARTDELTALRNRRAFHEWGGAALEQASRYGRPLSIILLDLDFFKAINDTHGHAAGDAALRHVSSLLQRSVRATDVTGRLGGEEFGIILPETSAVAAMVLAERLRARVQDALILHGDKEIRLTSSFGIAGREGCTTLESMLEKADLALYEAKEGGRNRTCLHVPPVSRTATLTA